MTKLGKYLHLLVLTVGLGLGCATTGLAAAPALKRGLNLPHWLTYWGRQPIVAADMTMIRQAGFDHVRLPFDAALLGWNPDSATPTLYWTALDHAVDIALQANLVVILDFHPSEALRNRIESEPPVQTAYLDLWQQLASHYASRPASSVVFELLNEPQYYDTAGPARWDTLQAQALARVRQSAPTHLVLLSGTRGGSIAGLLLMTPVADANVRYVFHFYEPMLLTHLGAPWAPFQSLPQGMITNLVYPAKNALAQVKLLPNADTAVAMAAVKQYVAADWSAKRIKQEVAPAVAWATKQKASLICTEFGTMRVTLDPVSRSRWMSDTRATFETLGIGWSFFDYADTFGIAISSNAYTAGDGAVVPNDPLNPSRVIDAKAVQALVPKP